MPKVEKTSTGKKLLNAYDYFKSKHDARKKKEKDKKKEKKKDKK